MANELLPCPFCGGDGVGLSSGDECCYASCDDCDISMCKPNRDVVAEAWNTRRATGLVNWLEWELSQADEVAGIVVRTKALQELRKMVKRILGQ